MNDMEQAIDNLQTSLSVVGVRGTTNEQIGDYLLGMTDHYPRSIMTMQGVRRILTRFASEQINDAGKRAGLMLVN